eukprot:6246794-Amphidinium_carterae.1
MGDWSQVLPDGGSVADVEGATVEETSSAVVCPLLVRASRSRSRSPGAAPVCPRSSTSLGYVRRKANKYSELDKGNYKTISENGNPQTLTKTNKIVNLIRRRRFECRKL